MFQRILLRQARQLSVRTPVAPAATTAAQLAATATAATAAHRWRPLTVITRAYSTAETSKVVEDIKETEEKLETEVAINAELAKATKELQIKAQEARDYKVQSTLAQRLRRMFNQCAHLGVTE